MKLIDKLQPISAISNVATVGYETLVAIFTNTASGADNYTGTKAEADAIKADLTIKLNSTTTGDGYDANDQYVSVRTIAGTKLFVVELSLYEVYVKSLTKTGASLVNALLTLPSNSKV